MFAVKASLSTEQMKVLDTFGQNMIIEAYSRCFEVDEAIKFFREMGLYGCQPNAYTCGYIATRLWENSECLTSVFEKPYLNSVRL